MPTYEYACRSCDEHVEVVQSFKDDPLTTCPSCAGPLRKVFGSIGISFKGSGFYKTDSRSSTAASSSGSSGSPDKTDKTKATPDKAAATPEKAAAGSSTAASSTPSDSSKKAAS